MPCCTNARPDAPLRRAWARLLLVLALAWAAALHPAQASARLQELRVEPQEGALVLYAQLHIELAPAVHEALRQGIAVHFLAQASIRRERWYWRDETLAQVHRHTRLAYQPLTRRWRVNTSSLPISNTEPGLTQYHDSLDAALASVQRIAGWKITDLALLQSGDGQRQTLDFRFQLDSSQWPSTLRVGSALGGGDWHWSIEQRLNLSQGGRTP